MGSDPYHWASSSDCHHLCRGRNYLHRHTARQIKVGGVAQSVHCHTARQIKVGGVTRSVHGHTAWQIKVGGVAQSAYMVTLLGRSRWVGSQSVHGHTARQIKVGGVTQSVHCHTAQQIKVGGVTQSASTLTSAKYRSWGSVLPPECLALFPGLPIVMLLIVHTVG